MILPSDTAHGEGGVEVYCDSQIITAKYSCGCQFKAPSNPDMSWPDWIGKEAQDNQATPESEDLYKLPCPHRIGYLRMLNTTAKFKTRPKGGMEA